MQDRLYPRYLLIPAILIFTVFFILPVIGRRVQYR